VLHNVTELNEQSQIWRKASSDITKMKRMTQSGFGFWKIVLITIVAVLFFAGFTAIASADTYYVATTGDDGIGDGSSGNPWRTIQHAVNTITEGNTIIVRDGTYTENVYVNKPHLTIRSENGAETTIVQAENQDGHVFEVTADYVNISGFTVDGATGAAGIILNVNDDYCTISNNDIVLNQVGIFLHYSSHNTVINNNINSNQYGIRLYKSGGNMVTNNNINSNHRGIYMILSGGNEITENTFKENAEYGLYMLCYKDYDLVIRCNYINRIYHNNFVDNFLKPQMYASDSLDQNLRNYLDDGYPSGGNYWSDYAGEDLYGGSSQDQPGSDGIGDTPYISHDFYGGYLHDGYCLNPCQDGYPLMNPWPPSEPDTMPPIVVSTSPEDGATIVAIDTVVTATFSEAMDSTTITTDSFALAGSAVSGTVTYDSDTCTAIFTPDAPLEYNHEYTATLSTAITDKAGNHLAEEYRWGFTTQSEVNHPPDPPTLLSQYKTDGTEIPVGGTTDESTVIFKGVVSDPDDNQVKLQIELRRLDEYEGNFIGEYTQESEWFSSGSEASITVFGLVLGAYHWQARTVDNRGATSDWVSFGDNPDSEVDFSTPPPPDYFSEDWIEKVINWASAQEEEGKDYWYELCMAFVSDAFKVCEDRPGSANDLKGILESAGEFYSQENGWVPPRGSVVFFSANPPYKSFGHIGISLGGERVIHSLGTVRIETIVDIEENSFINSYLGWAYPPESFFDQEDPSHRSHKFKKGDSIFKKEGWKLRDIPSCYGEIITDSTKISGEGEIIEDTTIDDTDINGICNGGECVPATITRCYWWHIKLGDFKGWCAEEGLDQPPFCTIELRKDGAEIDEIDVGEFFDIYVGDSTDDTGIGGVSFSSDESQDGIPTGEWTEWYDWDTSSGDWDAEAKIKRWAFDTGGEKEVWAEVKDDAGNVAQCHANIFVHPEVVISVTTSGSFLPIYEVILWLDPLSLEIVTAKIADSASLSIEVEVSRGDLPVPGARVFIQEGSFPLGVTDENGIAKARYPITHPPKAEDFKAHIGAEVDSSIYLSEQMTLYSSQSVGAMFFKVTEDEAKWYPLHLLLQYSLQPGVPAPEWLSGIKMIDQLAKVAADLKDYNPQAGDMHHVEAFEYTASGVETAYPVHLTTERGGAQIYERTQWTDKYELVKPITLFKLAREAFAASLASPANLWITDPNGRHAGIGPQTGELVFEFPMAITAPEEEHQQIVIPEPSDGEYTFGIIGTREGGYNFICSNIDETGHVSNTFTSTNIPTAPGAVHQYTIDWEALSQGEKGVTVQIDSDGNGVFEQTIITDNTFQLPIASFTYTPENPVVYETITFDASDSYDPDGTITKYEWDFGNGDIIDTTEPIITHSYALAGDYTVNLMVTDDDGGTEDYMTTVTVISAEEATGIIIDQLEVSSVPHEAPKGVSQKIESAIDKLEQVIDFLGQGKYCDAIGKLDGVIIQIEGAVDQVNEQRCSIKECKGKKCICIADEDANELIKCLEQAKQGAIAIRDLISAEHPECAYMV